MKKDSEVRMISDMQHLFSMQIPLYTSQKRGKNNSVFQN